MRSEQEMYHLILNTAIEDERIRAVYMNGSRTNDNAVKDIFRDYDIVYVVTETEPFREQRDWIDLFGERLYMQCPEEMDLSVGRESNIHNCYGWLIQLADGNRIDLHVQTVSLSLKVILEDKLCKILIDKDHILPEIPASTDEDYFVKKPSEAEFLFACNEFWWCLNNVAKGLFRKEVPYVQDMLNQAVRPQLFKLLSWKIGIGTKFSCSIGKSGKYMDRFLPESFYNAFLETYCPGRVPEIWDAVFGMCGLFSETACEVSGALGYAYDKTEEKNSLGFLEQVKELPQNAADRGFLEPLADCVKGI